MIDYQIQTTASDGKYAPRDCVRMARENDVLSIAITDHDTVGGLEEGLAAGKEFVVEVIAGVELSCEYRGYGIHMLGLGIDHTSESLRTLFVEMKQRRKERAQHAITKLKEQGITVDFEKVARRAEGVIASPHLADEILENPANAAKLKAEGVVSRKDLYPLYLGDGARFPVYPNTPRLSAEEAIKVIHAAGGIAVWSHPTIPMGDYKLVEDSLVELVRLGMEGIEAIGNFTEDDTEFLNMLVGKYGVLKTAGSDFHDTWVDPLAKEQGATAIGALRTFGYPLEGIRETVLSAIAKRKVAEESAV